MKNLSDHKCSRFRATCICLACAICLLSAHSLASELKPNPWLEIGYIVVETDELSPQFHPVELGSSVEMMRQLEAEHQLLGVRFAPPEAPKNISAENIVNEIDIMFNYMDTDGIYLVWLNNVRPAGKWDLKNWVRTSDNRRLEYENAGNFFFGLGGRRIGNPRGFLNFGAGFVNQMQAMWRGNRQAPYGGLFSPTFGDDPVDFVYSEMGQDYYDSGQVLLDYFDNPSRLPPGPQRDRAELRLALKRSAHSEAESRLREHGFLNDEVRARLAEEERRREAQRAAEAAKAEMERREAERRQRETRQVFDKAHDIDRPAKPDVDKPAPSRDTPSHDRPNDTKAPEPKSTPSLKPERPSDVRVPINLG